MKGEIESVDELPLGWSCRPLRELLEETPRRNPVKDGEGSFMYVDIDAVDNKRQAIATPKKLENGGAPSRARNEIWNGDVIFSLVRPYLKNIALVPASLDRQIASTAFYICRPGTGLDSGYLFHYLNRNDFINTLPTYGNSPPAARDDEFVEQPIALPDDVAEQRRIVERIEALLSDVDAGVASLRRARRKTVAYRASVLKAATTGTLTAGWREQHSEGESTPTSPDAEPADRLLARLLTARRECWEQAQQAAYAKKGKQPPKNWQSKYKPPVEPDAADLPDLPADWRWVTSSQVCSGVDNGNTPPKSEMFEGGGEVPFVKVYNLTHDGRLDFTVRPTFITRKYHESKLAKSVARPGDVLMNIVGPPLGKVSLVPDSHREWNMNQAVVVFRPLDGLLPKYLTYCLLSESVIRPLTGKARATAGQFNISVNMSREVALPLPTLAEQREIVDRVEERLSVADAATAALDAAEARAARLRQSILRDAFTGRLTEPKCQPQCPPEPKP
jgi:type I restriction enzyme S subunit